MNKKIIGNTVGTTLNPNKVKPTADEIKQAVDIYLAENPIEGMTEEQKVQLEKNTSDIDDLKDSKADKTDIPTAVNEALTQAKKSGEFNGKDGSDAELTGSPIYGVRSAGDVLELAAKSYARELRDVIIYNLGDMFTLRDTDGFIKTINTYGLYIVTFTDSDTIFTVTSFETDNRVGTALSYYDTLIDELVTTVLLNGKDGIDKSELTDHTENDDIHVTANDKAKWDRKSDFSGKYADLVGQPTIPTVPTEIGAFNNDVGYLTEEVDPTVPLWAKQKEKPTYDADEVGARPKDWMPTAEDVGADPSGTATNKISEHNTKADAHNDIRLLITELTNRLNTVSNSEDVNLDQLSEIVDYIKNNKSLIDGITTSKVNVTDIIDNLSSNVSNKPLSAAQGAVLDEKKLDASKLPEAVNSALAQAKASGEFDGKDGDNGYTPEIGTNGNWYINGVDTGETARGTVIANTSINGAGHLIVAFSDGSTLDAGEAKGRDGKDATSPIISVSAITGGNRVSITDVNGTKTVDVMNGGKGDTGKGISNIARTSGSGAAGTTDTYTITYTDNTTNTFTVYNGKNGSNGVSVTHSWSGTTLTVTSASGTSTVNLKGEKGDKGDAYTLNDTDKTTIVNAVITALPKYTGGVS